MKKFLLVFALVAILTAGTAYADHPGHLGIGIVGGYYGGWNGGGSPNWGLSLKLPVIPVFWGVWIPSFADPLVLHVTGDSYIFDLKLVPPINLHWYLGLGGYVGLGFYDKLAIDLGVRVPIGLSWQPVKFLELFFEVAPSFGVHIHEKATFGGGWPLGLGLRLWI